MPGLTAASALPLAVQGIEPMIAEALEAEAKLAKLLGSGEGGATQVSLIAFRVRLQTALPGAVAQVNLDTGSLPSGSASQWDQMTLTPISYVVPIQYSQLAQMTSEGGQSVATDNAVAKTIADVAKQAASWRDIFLQTPGDGSLASVASTASQTITLNSGTTTTVDGRRAQLIRQGQQIQIMSPAYVLRGACNVQRVYDQLGSTQSILVDNIPPGVIAGDLIIVAGATPGGPQFINGIPFFVNTSTLGNLYGISRSNPYVVANGVPLGGAQVTVPSLRLAANQVIQRLGDDGLADQFWHTHPSQKQAYEEVALSMSYIPLQNGKADSFDPLFQNFSIDGRPIYFNIHADQTRWDLLLKKSWKTVKWGKGMFWLKTRDGRAVFPQMDPTTGNPTVQELMYYTIAEQFFVQNPIAQGGLTNAKVPQNN